MDGVTRCAACTFTRPKACGGVWLTLEGNSLSPNAVPKDIFERGIFCKFRCLGQYSSQTAILCPLSHSADAMATGLTHGSLGARYSSWLPELGLWPPDASLKCSGTSIVDDWGAGKDTLSSRAGTRLAQSHTPHTLPPCGPDPWERQEPPGPGVCRTPHQGHTQAHASLQPIPAYDQKRVGGNWTFAAKRCDLSERVVTAVALAADDAGLAGTLPRVHVARAAMRAMGEAVAGQAGLLGRGLVVILL